MGGKAEAQGTLNCDWEVGVGIGLAKCKWSVWAVGLSVSRTRQLQCAVPQQPEPFSYLGVLGWAKSGAWPSGKGSERGPFMDTQGIPTEGLQPQSVAGLEVASGASPESPAHPEE